MARASWPPVLGSPGHEKEERGVRRRITIPVPEGQGFFRSPDAGKIVIKAPLKPRSYRAFKKESRGAV